MRARRSCSCTAPPRPGRATGVRSARSSASTSGSSSPMRAATVARAGTWPTAGGGTTWWTTWSRSSTPWASSACASWGFRWAGSRPCISPAAIRNRVEVVVVAGASNEPEPPRTIVRRQLDLERIEREEPGFAAEMARLHDPVQGPDAWRSLLAAIRDDLLVSPSLAPEELSRIRRARPAGLRRCRRLGSPRAGPEDATPAAPGSPPRRAGRACRARGTPGLFNPAALAFLRSRPTR